MPVYYCTSNDQDFPCIQCACSMLNLHNIPCCFLVGYTTDSNICLETRVRPCCPEHGSFPVTSVLSTTTVNIAGETVTLTYYITEDKGKYIFHQGGGIGKCAYRLKCFLFPPVCKFQPALDRIDSRKCTWYYYDSRRAHVDLD